MTEKKTLTTSQGMPVANDLQSMPTRITENAWPRASI